MNYGRLKELIRTKYGNQREFAKCLGVSYTVLNQRLNGKSDWSATEMIKTCALLDIPLDMLHLYFFDKKV